MAFGVIAFVAGLLTVLAPCILPLLPVIVGGSLGGERSLRRAAVLVVSLGASVFVFTLLLKVSTLFIDVPQSAWQWVSGGLLLVFGIVTFFPGLWEHLPVVGALNRGSNRMLGAGYQRGSFLGEILMGAALGPVFSSCSPTYFIVLATVLPANVTAGVAYLLLYVIGLSLALFAVAVVGQRAALALGVASDPRGWFKRGIGVLFILIGLAIVTGADKVGEQWLLDRTGIFDITQVEQALLGSQSTTSPTLVGPGVAGAGTPANDLTPTQKAMLYPQAPELAGIDGYLNTDGKPITLGDLRGKVVLVDFWTYSCINCLRTIPYLTAWYDKYKDQGFVIVGVHTPEFAFEHVKQNVADAIKRLGITYPVVQDNKYQTWRAFGNQFWPREYLIDIDGYIVHDHAGEGEYDVTERAIQQALAERAARMGQQGPMPSEIATSSPDLSGIGSPETYFGAARNEYLGNGTPRSVGTQTLTLPESAAPNTLYLGGTWDFASEYAQNAGPAQIKYYYSAGDVYLVASAEAPVTIEVSLDGKPVGEAAGEDVDPATSKAVIKDERLYKLVHTTEPGAHVITITISGAGLRVYTFTFG